MMKTRIPFEVYCANDQKVTPHNHLPDNNNEVLLQCTVCGRFLKFPPGVSRSQLTKMFVAHEKDNVGQIVVDDPGPSAVVYSRVDPPELKKNWLEKLLGR